MAQNSIPPLRQSGRKPEQSLPGYRLPLEFVGVILIGLTGHLGGSVSGVNGPG